MKKILFIWTLVILIIAGCAPKSPPEYTILGMGTDYSPYPDKLNGRVKELTEKAYWAVEQDGKMTKGDILTWKELDSIGSTKNFRARFDSSGVLSRYDLLDDNDLPRYSDVAIFSDGRCVKWERSLKDSLYSYWVVEYDDAGYQTAFTGYRPVVDTLLGRIVMTHDGNGNFTRSEYYNPANERLNYQTYLLDAEGRVTEYKSFNRNDSLVFTFINTYDEKGAPVRLDAYFERTKETDKWEMNDMSFDDHGNCIERFCRINDGEFQIITGRDFIYY